MRGTTLLVGTVMVLSACATRSAGSAGGWHSLGDVDETPVLLECALQEPLTPSLSRTRTVRVEVVFDVDASGAVVSPVARLQTTRLGAGGVTGLAMRVVNSCHYLPARLDGEPVGVRGLRRYFSFAVDSDR